MKEQLLQVFEQYRMNPTPIDEYETKGKTILAEKFDKFIVNNQPIEFVMLGFPFKSTNIRDKVLGVLPDLGELLTLKNFAKFNEDIKQVYAPGIKLNMVSDGFVFNDILEVPDSHVDDYKQISMSMAKDAPIEWHDLWSFVKTREQLMENFAPSPLKLEQDILMNPDVNFLYRGMVIFMTEETAMRSFPSNNQHQKFAKKLARDMMFRNEAYSELVRREFSNAIRLSMHPSVNNGAKYSFQLIKGKSTRYSAWHCAIAVDQQGQIVTIHRKDAEAAGFELIYENNQPYYYANRQSNF